MHLMKYYQIGPYVGGMYQGSTLNKTYFAKKNTAKLKIIRLYMKIILEGKALLTRYFFTVLILKKYA